MTASAAESALIVSVPAADPVVGMLRNRLDSSAPLGVPAHITVLYPFMPPELIDPQVVSELEELFSGVDGFDLALTSVGWFETAVVYLVPGVGMMTFAKDKGAHRNGFRALAGVPPLRGTSPRSHPPSHRRRQ